MIQFLVKNFVRGLLFVVPVAATGYAIYALFVTMDGWINVEPLLNRRLPGAGVVVTLAFIIVVGFLASNFLTRWLFNLLDRLLANVPLVRLLYTSIKDLIGAFVGDKKKFDRPVLVELDQISRAAVMGFITRDDMSAFGLTDEVAVYLPQSYNFAGNLILIPRSKVRPVKADSSEVMAFIVSGGITGNR
jgi:uncharacterized membrane protein